MALTEQQAWLMPLPELKRKMSEPEIPAELQQLENAWADFKAAHPGYKDNSQNRDAVLSYIVNPFIATAADFRQAFALASYEKRINDEPAPVDVKAVSEMSLEQLREAAFPQAQPDAAWTTDLPELKKQAGLE